MNHIELYFVILYNVIHKSSLFESNSCSLLYAESGCRLVASAQANTHKWSPSCLVLLYYFMQLHTKLRLLLYSLHNCSLHSLYSRSLFQIQLRFLLQQLHVCNILPSPPLVFSISSNAFCTSAAYLQRFRIAAR